MRALRVLLAIVVCAAALFGIEHFCWQKFQCNVAKKTSEGRLLAAAEKTDSERAAIGRGVIARLQPCIEHDPADYEALIFFAHAHELTGAKEKAIAIYRAALAANERPEIYASIALLQLEKGDLESARRNLLRASYFSIEYTASVDEPLRRQLYADTERRLRRLQTKIDR